jgi:inorganic phosphate transporter, PiT family
VLLMVIAVLALTFLLAAANAANDVAKGVATLVGSGLASVGRAIAWGIVTTAAGGLVAAFATQGLVKTFSGAGLVNGAPAGASFFLAVAAGAVLWLVFATLTGLPVSTTHSLIGGLIGVAIVARGFGAVAWQAALVKIAAPLLLSPLLGAVLVLAVLPLIRRGFARYSEACVCVSEPSVTMDATGAASLGAPAIVVASSCEQPVVARVRTVDTLHWLSSGTTSFFRGMNDVPKIVGIGVGAAAVAGMPLTAVYALVVVAMSCGALLGQRVVRTLACKVTRIEPDSGLAANAATSVLVGLASAYSLPVSTTHVSSGAIFGIGASREGTLDWSALRGILVAWGVTLPVSALLAGGAFALLR